MTKTGLVGGFGLYDTVAALLYVTKQGKIPVQGDIDKVLCRDDIPTGIWDLTLFADGGSFWVDYADRTKRIKRSLQRVLKVL